MATAGYKGIINEGPIRNFLETQQAKDSKPVLDFCFTSTTYDGVHNLAGAKKEMEMMLGDVSNFVAITSADMNSVPPNFFNVTGTEYFLYDSIQGGLDFD